MTIQRKINKKKKKRKKLYFDVYGKFGQKFFFSYYERLYCNDSKEMLTNKLNLESNTLQ